jgi:hypothetical protein
MCFNKWKTGGSLTRALLDFRIDRMCSRQRMSGHPEREGYSDPVQTQAVDILYNPN